MDRVCLISELGLNASRAESRAKVAQKVVQNVAQKVAQKVTHIIIWYHAVHTGYKK